MRQDERLLWFGLAVLAVVIVAVGTFLPLWDEGSVLFAGIQGNSLLQSGNGWVTLISCAWALVWLVRAYQAGTPTRWPLVLGVIVLGFAIYSGWGDEQLMTLCPLNAETTDAAGCQVAKPGIGVYAVAAGGGLLALAGLFIARPTTPAPAPATPAD